MTNETLLRHLPNYIASGFKESTLISKILPSAESAESWAEMHVSPRSVIEKFPGNYGNSEDYGIRDLKFIYDDIVAVRALWLATPMLDVTMHPNGLAVVNTDSLAPASAERAKAFREALEFQLLNKIDTFLSVAFRLQDWVTSYPAESIWNTTLFTGCQDIIAYMGTNRTFLDVLESIRNIHTIEEQIAERWISPELMSTLRKNKYLDTPRLFRNIIHPLKYCIAHAIRSDRDPDYNVLRMIVERIRTHPEEFPEWHSSETARLFSPPVFRNKKKSGGYFF